MLEILQHNTTVWVAISFAIFCFIAVKFGGKSFLKTLDDKIAQIRNDIETARRLKEEAQALLAEFRQKEINAENEAQRIVDEARASAKLLHETLAVELAETMVRREVQLAERLKRMEDKAVADIQNHAADLALEATREIVLRTLDEKAASKLIDQSIQSVPKHFN